jgi:hypothetical protein
MKRTPGQAFFNSAPIDPKAPHPYFLNRGIDTTRFSDLDRVVRVEPRYRREQTHAWGPALIAAVTDNEGSDCRPTVQTAERRPVGQGWRRAEGQKWSGRQGKGLRDPARTGEQDPLPR